MSPASAGGAPNAGGAATPTASAPAEPAMTPEQQVLMIEAQRLDYMQKGDSTELILPPTEMTPEVTGQPAEPGAGPTPGQ